MLTKKLFPLPVLFISAVLLALCCGKDSGPSRNSDKIQLLHDYFSGIPVSCDINGDSKVNIADAIALILLGRDKGPAADWNGDGAFGISDVISYILDVRDGRCD